MEKPQYRKFAEQVMRDNNGHASLKLISREFDKQKHKFLITGQTPHDSLRAAVLRGNFKRIGLGVYALKSADLPSTPEAKTPKEKTERRHSDIQGMLLAIGNNKKECADTYTPDRSKIFNDMQLGSIATLEKLPHFTYDNIINIVRQVDVMWINERGFPASVFEVEHTTTFTNALSKFCELQDFHAEFYCVAEEARRGKFERELGKSAFSSIKTRCEFRSYERIEQDYRLALQKSSI